VVMRRRGLLADNASARTADRALSAVMTATDPTRIERGQSIEVPKTELRKTVGSLPGDAHRA
jgi:hypothetical protein